MKPFVANTALLPKRDKPKLTHPLAVTSPHHESLTMPVWEWQDNHTTWTPFLAPDRATIEKLYSACNGQSIETRDLSWNRGFNTLYRYDFRIMTQVNTESKKKRQLRRRLVACCPKMHTLQRIEDMSDPYGSDVFCDTCHKNISESKEAFYHCSSCRYDRCLVCQGDKVKLQSLEGFADWQKKFTALSRSQVEQLRGDVSVRAQLERDGLEVVWRQWLDAERSFGSEEGKTTTDITLFAIPPESLRSAAFDDRQCVNFPVVKTPNYCDEVDVVSNADGIVFDVRNRYGQLVPGVTLRQFLAQLGQFISDLEPLVAWSDPIDDTPLQTSSQFSIIPSPSGCADVGIAAFGHACTNLHVVIGPSGDLGWAVEQPGAQRIFFRDSTGRRLHAISLVPEKREEVSAAFFKIETHDESVHEERQRYERVKNCLVHLQITMDGVVQGAGSISHAGRGNLCPGGHDLCAFLTPVDGYLCDKCGKTMIRGSKMFGCRPCDFDHCVSCWRSCAPKGLTEPSVHGWDESPADLFVPSSSPCSLSKPSMLPLGYGMPPSSGYLGPSSGCGGTISPMGVPAVQSPSLPCSPSPCVRRGSSVPLTQPGCGMPLMSVSSPSSLRNSASTPISHCTLLSRKGAPTAQSQPLSVPIQEIKASKEKKSKKSRRRERCRSRSRGESHSVGPERDRRRSALSQTSAIHSEFLGKVSCSEKEYLLSDNRRDGSGGVQQYASSADQQCIDSGLLLAVVEKGYDLGPVVDHQKIAKGASRKAGVAVRLTYMHYGLAADGRVSAERTRRFVRQSDFRRRELGLPHGSLVSGLGSWGGPENAPIKLFGFRLTDAGNERRGLEIIDGVSVVAVPRSLEAACTSLAAVVPGVGRAAAHAERAAKALVNKSGAALEQVAAIYLYTMEHNFYRQLNAAMRDADRSKAKPFFAYLRLLFTALENMGMRRSQKMPELWRGVHLDLQHDYPIGSEVTWWGASSCTPKLSVANGFLGSSGPRTLFKVQHRSAVPIKEFSAFRGEEEWLLAPGTRLRVEKVVQKVGGLCEISLVELEPPRDIR